MPQETNSKFEFVSEDGTSITAHRHVNPNGELGGWVADNAVVGEGATIALGGLVAPFAMVAPGQNVAEGQLIARDID